MKQPRKRQPLSRSFYHAFEGIVQTIKTERNIKIHLGFTALVILFGLLLRISTTEWMICLVLFGLVLSLELVNTAVEAAVDLVTAERRPLAKKAKDASAGAVLISAVFAAIIGLWIFVPKLIAFFPKILPSF